MGNASPPGNSIPDPIRPRLTSDAEQRAARMAIGRIIIVCGGRDYADWERVWPTLDMLHARAPINLLVHGADLDLATGELVGSDLWADLWALDRAVGIERHPPDRMTWGSNAEAIRDRQMGKAGAHGLVAFPGAETRPLVLDALRFGMAVWRPFK